MADYTRRVKKVLSENGCYFIRHGKGDHDIWYSPVNGNKFVVDNNIVPRTSANETLKRAGLKVKL